MRDITYHAFGKTFWLRVWTASAWGWYYNVLYAFKQQWSAKRERIWSGETWMRTLTQTNAECYCPEGSISEFHLGFAGLFGIWFEVRRGGPKRPCPCDKIQWLLFPEFHGEEIEEYGLAKLQAEYPGVNPI